MSDRAIPVDGRSYQVDGRAVARSAIPDVEDWQRDNPLDDWQWDTDDFSVVDEGPTGRALADNNSKSNAAIYRPDGIDATPEKGDVFSSLISRDHEFPAWGYGFDSDGNGYSVFPRTDEDVIGIRRYDGELPGGNGTDILEFSYQSPSTQFIETEIKWHDGSGDESDDTHEVTVFEWDDENNVRGDELGSDTVVDDNYADQSGITISNEADRDATFHTRYVILGQVGE